MTTTALPALARSLGILRGLMVMPRQAQAMAVSARSLPVGGIALIVRREAVHA